MLRYDLPPAGPDNPYVGLDLETTGLDFYKENITLVGLWVDGQGYALPWDETTILQLKAMQGHGCIFVMHNGFGFDLPFMIAKGVDVSTWQVYDTAIGERQIMATGYYYPKSYKNTVKAHLDIDLEKDKTVVEKGFHWNGERLSEKQESYVLDDIAHLVSCFEAQVTVLDGRDDRLPEGADEIKALVLDQQAVIPTAYLNASVLPIDIDTLQTDYDAEAESIEEMLNKLGIQPYYKLGRAEVVELLWRQAQIEYKHAGLVGAETLEKDYPSNISTQIANAMRAKKSKNWPAYNRECHELGIEGTVYLGLKQIKDLLEPKWGEYPYETVSKDNLRAWDNDDSNMVADLLEARSHNSKRLALIQMHEEHGGLRSTYMLSGSASGRYTAKGESEHDGYKRDDRKGKVIQQAQNILKEFRPRYIKTEDKWFLILDYAQQELRIQAAMFDTHMTEVLQRGEDVYQAVADKRGIDRWTAKQVTLGLCYGMGKGPGSQLAKYYSKEFPTQASRDALWNGFHADWPITSQRIKDAYEESNKAFHPFPIVIPGGMIRVLQPRKTGQSHTVSPSDILNTPVQGAGGVAAKRSLVMLTYRGYAPHLRIALHDELGLLFDTEEEVRRAAPIVATIMSDACNSVVEEVGGANVEFPVEVFVGQCWGKPE